MIRRIQLLQVHSVFKMKALLNFLTMAVMVVLQKNAALQEKFKKHERLIMEMKAEIKNLRV